MQAQTFLKYKFCLVEKNLRICLFGNVSFLIEVFSNSGLLVNENSSLRKIFLTSAQENMT